MSIEGTEDDDTDRRDRSIGTRIKQALLNIFCPVNIDVKAYTPLLLILLSEGITSSSVNSYIGYLIVDIGAASDTDDAGTWSGILTSSFFLCQFISSFMMGFFSDNFGRRPTLLIGVFGSFATQFCFGFSTNIWMAIALRGANGLLNGNISVVKTCIAELTDKTNRVKAFTYVGLMVGAGRIIGSTLGGYTARPAIEYSDTFSSDGFFGKYPYALSNFCVSSIILFTFIIAFLFTKETSKVLEAKRAERARKKMLKRNKGMEHDITESEEEESIGMEDLGKSDEHKDETNGAVLKKSNNSDDDEKDEDKHSTTIPISNDQEGEDDEAFLNSDEGVPGSPKKKGLRLFCSKLNTYKYTIITVTLYTLASVVQITTFSQIATWTVASVKSGGLDFTPRDVGLTTAIGGVATVFSLFFIAGPVIKVMSVVRAVRMMGLILTPVLACMPLGNNIARHGSNAAVWGLEGILVFLWQATVQIMINAVNVLVPNSVPNEKLAMAQAASQASSAIGKAIGPTVIGAILEWSLRPGRKFPFNYFCTFFILAFICVVYSVLTFFLPPSINYPYGVYDKMMQEEKERKGKENEGEQEKVEEKEEEEEEEEIPLTTTDDDQNQK